MQFGRRSHGARDPADRSRHLGSARAHLRAAWSSRRCGLATATSTPRRCTTTSARSARDCARPASSATRCSSPPRCGRRISRRATSSAPPRRAWRELRLSEVDLLLLHWPNPHIPLAETLGALCKVKRDGLARHIGVSNFTVALIEEAVRLAERAAGLQPDRGASVSRPVQGDRGLPQHGMAVVAYSPIARGGAEERQAARAASARRTARPPRRWACAFWCSRGSSSSRAPAGSSGCRRISRSSTSSCRRPRWRRSPRLASRDGRIVDYAYSGSPKWD